MRRYADYLLICAILAFTVLLGTAILNVASGQMTPDITAFNAGEVSPLFYARTDFNKYGNAAKTLQNMMVTSLGPVVRRPGLKYIAEVKDSNDAVRLIPFEYSNTDTYILEFGPRYMRVFRSGSPVIQNDDSVYEEITPFDNDELSKIQFVQSADVMYLVDGNDRPQSLSRTDHNVWTFTALDYNDGPFQLENNTDTTIEVNALTISGTLLSGWRTSTSYTKGDVNTNDYILYECISNHTSGGTTEPGTGDDWLIKWKEIVLPDNAIVGLTASASLFAATDVNSLWQLTHKRPTSLLSGKFTSVATSASIACSSKYTAVTHGTWQGKIRLERSADEGDTWELVEARSSENDDNMLRFDEETEDGVIYRFNMSAHVWGHCKYDFTVNDYEHSGSVRITSHSGGTSVVGELTSTLASTKATKLWNKPYWSDSEGWPSTIEFHEGRLYYGGNTKWPQTIWASKTGDWPNMEIGPLETDAIIFLLPGQNSIEWMLSHDQLLLGSTGGTGIISGALESEPISATSINYQRESRFGSAPIRAVLAGDVVLYVERDTRTVRGFAYDFVRDSHAFPDMTILSSHITKSGIKEVGYQSHPDSILWCVRNDGDSCALVYEGDNDVVGWSHIVTDGDFESVAVIPSGEEDEVWFVVNRTINGITRRYIEQLQTYDWGTDQIDCFFVDCGLSWDGGDAVAISNISNAEPGIVTVSTWPTEGDGSNLGDGHQVKLLAVKGMTQVNGTVYTINNPNVGSKTFELRDSADSADVNTSYFGTYSSAGTVQRFEKTFTNLGYLEGEELSILSDGGILADVTVAGGSVTVSQWTNKLHIGLGYTSVLETLALNLKGQFGSLALNQKRLTEVGIDFYQTAGAQYGTDSGNLQSIVFRAVSDDPNSPVPLFSGVKRMNVQAGWNDRIIIYVNQEYALPLTVRGITAKVDVGN